MSQYWSNGWKSERFVSLDSLQTFKVVIVGEYSSNTIPSHNNQGCHIRKAQVSLMARVQFQGLLQKSLVNVYCEDPWRIQYALCNLCSLVCSETFPLSKNRDGLVQYEIRG